jgi:predicted RNA-binding protein with PUA-like domain
MRPGDLILLYHSSCDPAGVVGVGRVASAARPDPTQFDPRDEHFDPKSRREAPTWWEVDVEALVRCPRFVTLADLRADPALAGLAVLQKGQRLSVQPVEARDFVRVLALAGLRPEDLPG